MKISAVIPTCNAGAFLEPLMQALRRQTVVPDEILIVDSASDDGTAERAEELGAKVVRIERNAFDHGGTRHLAVQNTSGDLVLFLTQDSLPAGDDYVQKLIAPFEDARVGAAGGRQVARPDARPFEKAVRAFNYPQNSSVWDASAGLCSATARGCTMCRRPARACGWCAMC